MTWSYSGNPSSSQLDELRFKIGDTDISDPELQNEELQYIIDDLTNQSIYSLLKASITALKAILAKFKTDKDEKVGDVDVKWSQRFKKVKELINELEQEHARSKVGSAFAGGISVNGKINQESNTDRVLPAFTKDFGRNKRLTNSGLPQENTSQIQNG